MFGGAGEQVVGLEPFSGRRASRRVLADPERQRRYRGAAMVSLLYFNVMPFT